MLGTSYQNIRTQLGYRVPNPTPMFQALRAAFAKQSGKSYHKIIVLQALALNHLTVADLKYPTDAPRRSGWPLGLRRRVHRARGEALRGGESAARLGEAGAHLSRVKRRGVPFDAFAMSIKVMFRYGLRRCGGDVPHIYISQH